MGEYKFEREPEIILIEEMQSSIYFRILEEIELVKVKLPTVNGVVRTIIY